MYSISVSLNNLNSQTKEHVLLIDFLLKEAIDKLPNHWEHCKSNLFLYLIKYNNNTWRVSLLPIELSADPTKYQYRAVTELAIEDLVMLTNDQQMRHKLLETLLPKQNHSAVLNYFDFKKEYSKDFN